MPLPRAPSRRHHHRPHLSARRALWQRERLSAAQRLYDAGGVRDRARLHAAATAVIEAEKRVKLQYISIAHPRTLAELDVVGADGAILSGAIMTTSTRLIDNVLLGVPGGL